MLSATNLLTIWIYNFADTMYSSTCSILNLNALGFHLDFKDKAPLEVTFLQIL